MNGMQLVLNVLADIFLKRLGETAEALIRTVVN
jgi:hypothetical protein